MLPTPSCSPPLSCTSWPQLSKPRLWRSTIGPKSVKSAIKGAWLISEGIRAGRTCEIVTVFQRSPLDVSVHYERPGSHFSHVLQVRPGSDHSDHTHRTHHTTAAAAAAGTFLSSAHILQSSAFKASSQARPFLPWIFGCTDERSSFPGDCHGLPPFPRS